ncbi:MAG: hypothetical protein Q8N12_03490 [Thermodesulfovibrionales bacterium]|nr:hypothetical protein [Thermodesulfovibrionales bacterium]
MKKIVLIGLILAVAVMSGCASYNTRGAMPILNRVEEVKLIKAEKEGVIITAFPIISESDSKKYFDENIIDKRVLAVYTDVFNSTTSSIKLISLNLKVGQKEEVVVASMTADGMYKILKREYSVKAFLWMFPTWFVGAPVSIAHTASVNSKIEEDIKEKQFQIGKEIRPKETFQGFVWFRIPKEVIPEDNDLPKGMALKLILEKEKKLIEYNLPML